MNPTKLSEYIKEVRDKTKTIIKFNKMKLENENENSCCDKDFCKNY